MIEPLRWATVVCLIIATACAWQDEATAVDRLYETTGESVTGTVTATDKKGVQLKKGGSTQTYLAGNIEKILFEGDPPGLTRGREFALDGQYSQALEELKKVDTESIKREVIKADVAFYTAMSQANLALSGKQAKESAVKVLRSFAGTYSDSWHFFDGAKLLGDLALALDNADQAMVFYKFLENAQSPDTKVESVYLQGRVQLATGAVNDALATFEKVISLRASSAATVRTQTLAKAGKAVALARLNRSDEGLKLASELIADLDPVDMEMSARIYNAQGASYEASGDDEGALLAYLHTHLMFSSQPDAHAEALIRLIELWPKVGQPARAAEARGELQQRYPGIK